MNKANNFFSDFEEVVLGIYEIYGNGQIFMPINTNMNYSTELITQIHEMSHMYLNMFSNMGILLSFLNYRKNIEKEKRKIQKIEKKIEFILGRISEIHEIYANNIELLWIEKVLGTTERDRIWKIKGEKYQSYVNYFENILSLEISIEEKIEIIQKMVFWSLNIDILSADFIEAFSTIESLERFFEVNHPKKRLNKIYNYYIDNNDIQKFKLNLIDISEFLNMYDKDNVIPRISLDFNKLSRLISVNENNSTTDSIDYEFFNKIVYNIMESKITVFSDKYLSVDEGNMSKMLSEDFLFVRSIKNNFVELLSCYKNSKELKYERCLAESQDFLKIFSTAKTIVFKYKDIEVIKDQLSDRYSKIQKIVLIDNIQQIQELLVTMQLNEEEFYFGDLYPEDIKNYFTVVAVVSRNDINTIYMFPTIKEISKKIIKKNNLSNRVLYSSEREYIKIFASFKKEDKILYFIKWFYAFITGDSDELTNINKSVGKLTHGLIRNLFDSVLVPHNNSDYLVNSFFYPTELTRGQPFYSIMRYDKFGNTGEIELGSKNGIKYIKFFALKELANIYLSRNYKKNLNNYKVVGIDLIYWNKIRDYLYKKNIFVVVVDNYLFCGKCFNAKQINLNIK
ncbi:hypothetical protein [Thomasclavelia spiroformis]|uniref:hypothetical protein n=1 Tax=Thomasclavelia spiroformis TaxID=29348 RepID=UPI00241CA6C6|nr:hypothetical protein [Thomasclavelia spiroformis]MBS6685241.1 hypothetical protein [Thomasclavelia spiroformis]